MHRSSMLLCAVALFPIVFCNELSAITGFEQLSGDGLHEAKLELEMFEEPVLSSPPVETETARRMLFSAVGACKFEEAWGYYEAANSSRAAGRSWDPEGKWQWRVFESACQIEDTLGFLMKQKGRPEWFQDKESIVLVGDSLDRMTVERFCAAVDYKRSETPPGLNAIEVVPDREFAGCSSEVLSVHHLKIFGLPQACIKKEILKGHSGQLVVDARARILHFVAHRSKPPTMIVMQSCLWDLSEPCTTGRKPPPQYIQSYASALHNITVDLSESLPDTLIFWRTCPPVSSLYDQKAATRTRQGQAMLNAAVRHEVYKLHRNGIIAAQSPIAWDLMVQTNYDLIDPSLKLDGRHYAEAPMLAYFNLVLNVLRDYRGAVEVNGGVWTGEARNDRRSESHHPSGL